ncbi:MAG: HAD-IC family P-type ATPase, partial [Limnoraphis sp.]
MTSTKEPQEQLDIRWTSSHSAEENLNKLSVETNQGLSASNIKKRREKYGHNRLQKLKHRSSWQIFIDQFKSPIIGLLAIAAILSFSFQDWVEGIAIIIAILLNTVIGFFTELKAVNSMESLQELSRTKANVRREGKVQEISAEELVPGDIVVLESGDLVPADVRILQASKLQADESALTGESLPVSKTIEALEGDLSLAERTNMLFKGTAITRGSGEGVVVATGMKTELGHISSMTAEAKQESTPLEQRLDKLGQNLIWVTLVIAVLVAGAGIIGGKELFLMIQTAIALAVAAVPEGLPIVATVALARGMWRMAKRNALINRLSAVETLGATNIICTDKTGTLTENRMTVAQIALDSGIVKVSGEALEIEGEFTQDEESINPQENDRLRSLLEVGVLCNKASLPQFNEHKDKPTGDPMEVALLVVGAKGELRR